MIKIGIPNSVKLFILKKKNNTFVYIKGYYKIYKIILPSFIIIRLQNENFITLELNKTAIYSKNMLFLFKHFIKKCFLQSIINKKKMLFLSGVGYKFYLDETYPYLAVDAGFSDLKIIKIPKNSSIKIVGRKENIIKISSLNYQLIGELATEIQKLKTPDSYKGKGIRMYNQKILLKKGKKPKQK
jgi:large subunit ribosomal protein L6